MNLDNRRLREIQQLKKGYAIKILASQSEAEVEHYYTIVDDLTNEEKEILKRNDVII